MTLCSVITETIFIADPHAAQRSGSSTRRNSGPCAVRGRGSSPQARCADRAGCCGKTWECLPSRIETWQRFDGENHQKPPPLARSRSCTHVARQAASLT